MTALPAQPHAGGRRAALHAERSVGKQLDAAAICAHLLSLLSPIRVNMDNAYVAHLHLQIGHVRGPLIEIKLPLFYICLLLCAITFMCIMWSVKRRGFVTE